MSSEVPDILALAERLGTDELIPVFRLREPTVEELQALAPVEEPQG